MDKVGSDTYLDICRYRVNMNRFKIKCSSGPENHHASRLDAAVAATRRGAKGVHGADDAWDFDKHTPTSMSKDATYIRGSHATS